MSKFRVGVVPVNPFEFNGFTVNMYYRINNLCFYDTEFLQDYFVAVK